MNSITQDLMLRQSVIKYSLKYGVTRASMQYRVNRRTIYRLREKYDGTIKALRNKSRKPHYHPNQHTKYEEMKYPGKRIQVNVKYVPAKCMLAENIISG